MNSKVGKSLASLKINLKGNFDLAILRLLETNCWKPLDAVPCDPYGPIHKLFDIANDPCEYNSLAGKMPRRK